MKGHAVRSDGTALCCNRLRCTPAHDVTCEQCQRVLAVPPCRVAGCDRPHQARGFCGLHYGREKRQQEGSLSKWDDIDDAVVERLIDGIPVPYTSGERLTAVVELRRRGLPLSGIAHRLGLHMRQVTRDLARHRALLSPPCSSTEGTR